MQRTSPAPNNAAVAAAVANQHKADAANQTKPQNLPPGSPHPGHPQQIRYISKHIQIGLLSYSIQSSIK